MVNRIVVGIQPPEEGEWVAARLSASVQKAVRLAVRLSAGCSLPAEFVVVLPEEKTGWFRDEAEARAAAETTRSAANGLLEDLLSACKSDGASLSGEVRTGRPWMELLRATAGDPQTMLICGTNERTAVGRLLFGGTDQKLIRNAAGPVWLVKCDNEGDAPPSPDANWNFDEDMTLLIGTDLTAVGEDLMHLAVQIGRAIPVKLNVMHVLETRFARQMSHSGASDIELEAWKTELRDKAEQAVHDQLSRTDYRTLEHGVRVILAEGRPEVCLEDGIGELQADLLMIATKALGGIPGMLFGTTAEHLLPATNSSVLVVKPEDFKSPVDLDDE